MKEAIETVIFLCAAATLAACALLKGGNMKVANHLEMTRGEEATRPAMNPGFIRQTLWGAFWATLILSTLAVLA